MTIRVLTPAGIRITAHDVLQDEKSPFPGTRYWVSSEGAVLGIVGKSIAPYRILHVLREGRRE